MKKRVLKYQEEVLDESIQKPFVMRRANEWIDLAKNCPVQERLFGDLWFENEIAVLFAETNAGKSILAVQIADSISSGIPIEPFGLSAKAQIVVYFDFELSDKQFEARYSIEGKEHYMFDSKLIRVEINPDAEVPCGDYTQYICEAIEACITEVRAKVAIIDNITYLNDELEKAKDALPLMKMLKAIKKKHNLSFLILAHTPKRDKSRPLSKNDLQGSKMIINFVDSAFVIGESALGKDMRYIKHLKARNTSRMYDGGNVLSCRIVKDHNFLRFDFLETGPEKEHLSERSKMEHSQLIEKTLELHQKGFSSRYIADVCCVSHTTINRMIKELRQRGELGKSGTSESVTSVPLFTDVPESSNGNKE